MPTPFQTIQLPIGPSRDLAEAYVHAVQETKTDPNVALLGLVIAIGGFTLSRTTTPDEFQAFITDLFQWLALRTQPTETVQ